MALVPELQVGVPTLVTQTTSYALPPVIVHLTATAAVEISADNSTFTALTGGNTVGAFTSAGWVRCTGSTTCTVVVKKF